MDDGESAGLPHRGLTGRLATRRQFSAKEKIRIVLSGLRGEGGIAELRRREGIAQDLSWRWSKESLELGKKRLAGDPARLRAEGAIIDTDLCSFEAFAAKAADIVADNPGAEIAAACHIADSIGAAEQYVVAMICIYYKLNFGR